MAEEIRAGQVSVSVQEQPTGMGDAIFGAIAHWAAYETILVVWGDQVGLSPATVRDVVAAHPGVGLTLPLVAMPEPYVEYELAGGELVQGCGSPREGDVCRPGGLSDVGVFCLATKGLRPAWERYAAEAAAGAATGEVNFLPFLPRLSPVTVLPCVRSGRGARHRHARRPGGRPAELRPVPGLSARAARFAAAHRWAAWPTLVSTVASGTSAGTTLVIARGAGASAFGQFTVVLSIALIVTVGMLTSLHYVMLQELPPIRPAVPSSAGDDGAAGHAGHAAPA